MPPIESENQHEGGGGIEAVAHGLGQGRVGGGSGPAVGGGRQQALLVEAEDGLVADVEGAGDLAVAVAVAQQVGGLLALAVALQGGAGAGLGGLAEGGLAVGGAGDGASAEV